MTHKHEVNKLILDKLKEYDAPENVKEFIIKILQFERRHWNEEGVHYGNDYDRLIATFSYLEGETDEDS